MNHEKKRRRLTVIALLCVLAIFCFACLGCAGGKTTGDDRSPDGSGESDGTSDIGIGATTVVMNVASDSTAYSSTAETVAAVADSVVEIRTESVTSQWGMQYIVSGAGSGVIVGRDAEHSTYYIVTNNHVIDGATDITVVLRTGKTYHAELIGYDVQGDIAVVTINESGELKTATWGNSDSLKVGEDLIAIGNPLGSLGGTVTKGILSAVERKISIGNYTMSLLQTDTAVNPGNSGGGLFNMLGQLIGVVNAKMSDEEVEGICFAIPANTATTICNDLITYGVVQGRVTLDITLAAATSQSGATAVYVTDVGSVAEGTFAQYDKLAVIGNKEISSLLDYNDALAELRPGDNVEITVYRGTVSRDWWGRENISFASDPTTFTVTARQLDSSR